MFILTKQILFTIIVLVLVIIIRAKENVLIPFRTTQNNSVRNNCAVLNSATFISMEERIAILSRYVKSVDLPPDPGVLRASMIR